MSKPNEKTEKIEISGPLTNADEDFPKVFADAGIGNVMIGKSFGCSDRLTAAVLAIRAELDCDRALNRRLYAEGIGYGSFPEVRLQAIRLVQEMERKAAELGLSNNQVVYLLRESSRKGIGDVIVDFPDTNIGYENYDVRVFSDDLEGFSEYVAYKVESIVEFAMSDFVSNVITERDINDRDDNS